MQVPAVQELLKQRPDVPTEKPKIQKTVEELEDERRALEVACRTFAGADGKGGTVAELTAIVEAEEREEAELVELLGANPELDQELAAAREARAEDRKQIERLKRAYDTLLQEIAELNKQIREARETQVKEGKKEVEKEAETIEDLTEHAELQPPPVPFAAREASLRVEERRQAMLAEAPDLTEHAELVTSTKVIPENDHSEGIPVTYDLSGWDQASAEAQASTASKETPFAAAEIMTMPVQETPSLATPEGAKKPEPAAKNERGPETVAQAQALIAEQQREQLEVRQRLLTLYKTYKEELLPQTQGLYEAAQALGSLGAVTTPGAEAPGPFAALQTGAKMHLDDARSLQGLFVGLQSEAMKNTPRDIEAATRDVQLVTARLQMRMQALQGYRNTLLGLRAGIPTGSAREKALLVLDAAAGAAWKAAGKMQAEWQPIGSKIQARNGREHHKLYEQAYGFITGERAKGSDIKIEIPEDVLKAMPKEDIPAGEDLTLLPTKKVILDVEALRKELPTSSVNTAPEVAPSDASQAEQSSAERPPEGAYDEAQALLGRFKRREDDRRDSAESILRRAHTLLSELDDVRGRAGQYLREPLEEVSRHARLLVDASDQSQAELLQSYDEIQALQGRLEEALETVRTTALRFEEYLPEDLVAGVRRMKGLFEEFPSFGDKDALQEAQKTIDAYEAVDGKDGSSGERLPRIGI